jgi:DNA-binding transcriptional MerR regulator
MLKIGEFAVLADISIKALRHYDNIGLLKPSYIDEESCYRYYEFTQLARAYRLTAFKNMGLALNEIGELLDGKMSPGTTRRFLRTKHADLNAQLKLLQEQIAYLDNKIYEVDMNGRMAAYEVLLKPLEPMKVLVASGSAPAQKDVGATIDSLRQRVQSYNVYPTASTMAMFPEYLHPLQDIPIEFAQPTDSLVHLRDDNVKLRLIPSITVASVIHTGSGDMAPGWVALSEWIQRNGYQVAGAFREVFLHQPAEGNPENYAFELQFPVKKVDAV